MSLVKELHGFGDDISDNAFGFEIELENVRGHTNNELQGLIQSGVVRIVEDGSLRNNGKEFVTRPFDLPKESSMLASVQSEILRSFPEVSASLRCGVHVHMNVRELTLNQLGRFLTLYCLVEKIILNHTGERGTNHFCVPVMDSENSQMYLKAWKSSSDTVHSLCLRGQKYSALNVKPVVELGTVEARMLAGEYWNTSKVSDLAKVLQNLKDMARQDHKAPEFKNWIWDINTTSSYEHFLQHVFGRGLLGVDISNEENQQLLRHAVFYFKCVNRG